MSPFGYVPARNNSFASLVSVFGSSSNTTREEPARARSYAAGTPLQRAAKLLPQNYLVQSQLGYCLMTVGQPDTAIGYLRKGAHLNFIYGPVWEHLGIAYLKPGRYCEAVDALEKATRFMPTSRFAWQRLAEAYQATGRTADAQRAASRAQQLGGTIAKVSKKKGVIAVSR